MGLPGLKGVQLERVKLANSLYEFTAKYVQLLHERNIGWSVENPSSSLMWVTRPFANLMLSLRAEISGVLFHTCMFGAPPEEADCRLDQCPRNVATGKTLHR